MRESTNLFKAILLIILSLDIGAKVQSGVVNEIRRMLRQIQQHEIEIQPHHAAIRQLIPKFIEKQNMSINICIKGEVKFGDG